MTRNIELCRGHKVWRDLLRRKHLLISLTDQTKTSVCLFPRQIYLVFRVEHVCVPGSLLQHGVFERAGGGVEQLKPHLFWGGDRADGLHPQTAHIQLQGKV